ncbi:hypothetical protein PIB30_025748 [Stylosanthes scabra]|uniref:Protein kinase domain-containing protein n=1 Tax=Stylosanthes scabra TaxID=79078 RepID=A0ABU6RAF4_9FABA|nr:hypothetical protein [Stylosanthes scabra]
MKSETVTFFLFLFLLWKCVMSTNKNNNNEIVGVEAAYMKKLRDAISPAPSTWFNVTNMCDWSHVICTTTVAGTRSIQEINLDSTPLNGTLPSGLNNSLPYITRLILHNTSLTGPLPSLAGLSNLQEVFHSFSNFTSIPHGCFKALVSLESLMLDNNTNLQPWTFPVDLTDSTTLNTLSLAYTNLMGSLPDIFASFPSLNELDLTGNTLNGSLPKSFGLVPNLQFLFLGDQKNGGFSDTIEFLSSMTRLIDLRIERNSLEGPIPDLSNCTYLQDLILGDNRLTGEVPPSLMNLSMLEEVSLENNFLQGPMPLFNTTITKNISIEGNGFCLDHPGPCNHTVTTLLQIAQAFGYPLLLARTWRGNNPCKGWNFITCIQGKIRTLNLMKLNLNGTISPAFGNLTDLRELYLGGNSLKGSIPESLTTLSQLKILDVSNNNLSGIIPTFSSIINLNTANNAFLVRHSSPTNQAISPISPTNQAISPTNQAIPAASRATPLWIKLGEGGYGIVYKASLADGQQVAVKLLKESKGSVEEFVDEVFIISRTSHVNIVSLLGFCYEKNKRALFYEFMHNDSLDKLTYRKGSFNTNCNLDWNILYQISIGIARGLEYLHHGCNTRILHLDIKLQNILLDEHFQPKITDFGLAKICKKDQSIISMVGTRGTPGYIAPDVFSRTYGRVSHKSDVYSYGTLILEIAGARDNYCELEGVESHASEICFPDLIYKDLEQGNIPTRYFPHKEEENGVVMKMILVSLWCIQPNPLDRPSISKVIEMLKGQLETIPYPPKPVLFTPQKLISSQYSDMTCGNEYDETSSIIGDEIILQRNNLPR